MKVLPKHFIKLTNNTMIDPHIPAFLLIGVGFLKKGVSSDEFAWKPTKQDVLALRAELKQYESKEINGRRQPTFQQHLVAKGICSLQEDGQLAVVSPFLYKREQDIKGLSDWIAEQDQKALFQAYPEEKVAYQQKIAEMIRGMRSMDKRTASA